LAQCLLARQAPLLERSPSLDECGVGGIRNQAFRILKINECFSRSDSRAKGLAAKSQEPLNLFSFFRIRLSA
jgi:hypothetical protein